MIDILIAKSQKLLFFLLIFLTIQIVCHDKWIVVTTINSPTKAIEILSKCEDWQVVVVADKKTPRGWYVENVIFLDVETQKKLPYQILNYLPWNHYCRKNIGYLYAIEHGAKIIYETDDDNYLLEQQVHVLPEYSNLVDLVGGQLVVNPYAFFGQPTVWPRGYPLKSIWLCQPESEQTKDLFIPIQQGLVNQDPDVDAIFRLTRPEIVNFEDKPKSLVLKKATFAPFNSQNTLFYYDAFWALLMPCSISLRVADIWRGYWAQRLLWDLNGQLCFTHATAYQDRNEHDLLIDFKDELDLYLKVDRLLAVLGAWKSDKPTLQERMLNLIEYLVSEKFIAHNDLELTKAWLEDLSTIGYKFPSVN